MSNVSPVRSGVLKKLVLLIFASSLSGCSYLMPEQFGELQSPGSTRQLNGLGVHRKMWESAGTRVLTPQKLSGRLDTLDVIVLVGRDYAPPGKLARDWCEQWLAEQPGRSVVYFGRDFDGVIYYREKALPQQTPPLQDEAARQLAQFKADLISNRVAKLPESTFCRWFYIDADAQAAVHSNFQGPWASDVQALKGEWPVGVILQPPLQQLKNSKPSWLAGKATTVPKPNWIQGADASEELGEKEVQRSKWELEELSSDDRWNAEWGKTGESKILLSGKDESPLVFKITSSNFPGSQILVCTNGAPFLNATLVQPLHQRIGEKIISECLPAKRVALLAYDENGLLISQTEGDEASMGMELLTVWPLSTITMHAAFFGMVLCVALLPILGRPQGLRPRRLTDFGLHVEALGRMLHQSRDILYSTSVIRDYYKKVREETPPPWLDSVEQAEVTSAQPRTPKSN